MQQRWRLFSASSLRSRRPAIAARTTAAATIAQRSVAARDDALAFTLQASQTSSDDKRSISTALALQGGEPQNMRAFDRMIAIPSILRTIVRTHSYETRNQSAIRNDAVLAAATERIPHDAYTATRIPLHNSPLDQARIEEGRSVEHLLTTHAVLGATVALGNSPSHSNATTTDFVTRAVWVAANRNAEAREGLRGEGIAKTFAASGGIVPSFETRQITAKDALVHTLGFRQTQLLPLPPRGLFHSAIAEETPWSLQTIPPYDSPTPKTSPLPSEGLLYAIGKSAQYVKTVATDRFGERFHGAVPLKSISPQISTRSRRNGGLAGSRGPQKMGTQEESAAIARTLQNSQIAMQEQRNASFHSNAVARPRMEAAGGTAALAVGGAHDQKALRAQSEIRLPSRPPLRSQAWFASASPICADGMYDLSPRLRSDLPTRASVPQNDNVGEAPWFLSDAARPSIASHHLRPGAAPIETHIAISGNEFHSSQPVDPDALADALGRRIAAEIQTSASGIYD